MKIFRSLEEQEAYHLEQMKNTTIKERFRRLYVMQQITRLFHPVSDHTRKIIVRNGYTQ
jgi:hypothetical protein